MGCCEKDEEYTRFMEGVEEFLGIDLDEIDPAINKNNWNFCEWRDEFIAWLRDNALIIGSGIGAAGLAYWFLKEVV